MSARLRRLFVLAAVLTTAATLAACGGDEMGDGAAPAGEGGGSQDAAGSSAGETVDTIVIEDFEYEPVDAVVEAGAEITFDNTDTAAHTASAEEGGVFDTGDIPAGEQTAVTVDQPGEYAYVCEFHPFMEGTLTVR